MDIYGEMGIWVTIYLTQEINNQIKDKIKSPFVCSFLWFVTAKPTINQRIYRCVSHENFPHLNGDPTNHCGDILCWGYIMIELTM